MSDRCGLTHPTLCARRALIAKVTSPCPERSTQSNGLRETVLVEFLPL
jgi:hypothetical protein